MKNENQRKTLAAAGLLAAFILWTAAICVIDVQPVGPQGSAVGFATVNSWFHSLTGVHMWLYVLTDWMGLVPVAFALGFAVFGLVQWIRRKHIRNVDRSILVLGGFYVVVMAAYIFFEEVVINYRPVLIDGFLEASYPSSTTLLVLCVMLGAMLQLKNRIKNRMRGQWVMVMISVFVVLMVLGRLLSGVHWLTDIIGGILLSGGLVLLYAAASGEN